MFAKKPYIFTERALFVGHALYAANIKVMYVPTTKAACSSIKLMLAEANGSYNIEKALKLPSPNISLSQTIHENEVSGLELFRYQPEAEQKAMWESDEWWRVGALRSPYARLYSTFENRILMRAPSMLDDEIWELCGDERVDGAIDVAATFRKFVRALHSRSELFYIDDHFTGQIGALRPDHMRYTHLFRVDAPGAMDTFAAEVSERSGKHIVAKRLNEGLGIKYHEVMDAQTAALVEEIYSDDFHHFGFEKEAFPNDFPALVASARETRAIEYARDITVRMRQISRLAKERTGWKYGGGQVLKDMGLRDKRR
ncbi:MAG: sulfotransferase family 2 domain-containing protein [Actinomycetes bacterium]